MKINSGNIVLCDNINVVFEVEDVFSTSGGNRIYPVKGSMIVVTTEKEPVEDYYRFIFSSKNCELAIEPLFSWYNTLHTV